MGENTAGGSDSALIFLCHFSGHVKGDEMRQARYWTSRSWLYLCNLVRDGDANQLAGGTPTIVLLGSFDWTSWESQESNYTLTPLPYIIYVLFHLCLKNPYQMSFAQNWEKGIDWSSSSDKSGSGIPATLCSNIRSHDGFSFEIQENLIVSVWAWWLHYYLKHRHTQTTDLIHPEVFSLQCICNGSGSGSTHAITSATRSWQHEILFSSDGNVFSQSPLLCYSAGRRTNLVAMYSKLTQPFSVLSFVTFSKYLKLSQCYCDPVSPPYKLRKCIWSESEKGRTFWYSWCRKQFKLIENVVEPGKQI